MKIFELLFNRYFRFQVRMGNADVAPFSSILIIAFVAMLYYFDFFILLSVLFPEALPNLSWKFNLIILLLLIIFLYFSLVHKGKWKKVIEEQEKSKKGKWLSIMLPIIAFLLFNFGFIIKILQNQGRI